MPDFLETQNGKFLVVAVQYFEAAAILDEAQRVRGRVLLRPTLALAGQGLELMLKATMQLNGDSPPTSGARGHDIAAMWEKQACEPIRGHVFANAIKAANHPLGLGRYVGLPEGDPIALIQEYILALAKLHGSQPYPLRYPDAEDTEAPVTPWLVSTLRMTADDFVKRPSEFRLDTFKGGRVATALASPSTKG